MPEEKNVQTGKLLYIGPIGSGKSAHINSLLSAREGRIAHLATEGNFPKSTTRKLTQFMCGEVLVSDTMGIEERDGQHGISIRDIISVVKGHVPVDYTFNPKNPITRESPDYKANPSNADKVHCVVMCMDAAVIKESPFGSKMRCLQKELGKIGVSTILLLTKIDNVCSEVYKDISYTFHSHKVKDAVRVASEKSGITEKFIYPVKNFKDEIEIDVHASILLLFALKKAMEFAQDHIRTLMTECKHA